MRVMLKAIFAGPALAAALCVSSSPVMARISPKDMQPLIQPGNPPQDKDERGLWHTFDEMERSIASSNLLVRDPTVTNYVSGVMRRLLGERANEVRVYVVQNSAMNASMAPNGMMIVHTGLLVRADSEAQLAAVLGHESGHYLRRHSVRSWRGIKAKTGVMAFVSAGAAVATGMTGVNWFDAASSVNNALLLSIFSHSRELESEADAHGLRLLYEAGYAPTAAPAFWANFTDERKASAEHRDKRYREGRSAFSSHPATADRMLDLSASIKEVSAEGLIGSDLFEGRAEYAAAMSPIRGMLIEEQVKLNDPGANLYLLDNLSEDGWNGTLRYYEGEVYRLRGSEGDDALAARAFASAITFADFPAEAFRGHGYALIKAGQTEQGRAALARYLELKPDASDAAMVRFSLTNQ